MHRIMIIILCKEPQLQPSMRNRNQISRRLTRVLLLAAVAGCGKVSPIRTVDIHVPARDVDADSVELSVVPPDSAIPGGPLGKSIRRGKALLENTHDSLPKYAPANLRCLSCHIDAGRRADAAPLVGTYARYPRYVDRSGAVVSIEERINYCFTRSLAGRRLPVSSREMQDIVAYLAFLSTGIPTGAHVRGEGLSKLPKMTGVGERGAKLFVANCVRCHGQDGQGAMVPVQSRGPTTPAFAPALWGARSFSIGAGLARAERTAAFIRVAMPYDKAGSLSDQESYDLAAYLLARPRPDLPGKERDWPQGGAPADVPYATKGHVAFHQPALIRRAGPVAEMNVPAPVSVVR